MKENTQKCSINARKITSDNYILKILPLEGITYLITFDKFTVREKVIPR